MKKLVALFLAITVVFCFTSNAMATTVQNSTTDSQVTAALNFLEQELKEIYTSSNEMACVENIVGCYRGDAVFAEHFARDPEDALGMVATVVSTALGSLNVVQSRVADGNMYYAEGVPEYRQSRTNSCGAASALQVIVQQGGADGIGGTTYTEKEETLMEEGLLDQNGSVYVYLVRDLINKYISGNTYAYINATNLSYSNFYTLVMTSLTNDCPIILHAMTQYIGYYNSNVWGHYIVGTHLFSLTDQLVVNDCNYQDAYTGVHTISMTEAYNSIHSTSGRYLIYGT